MKKVGTNIGPKEFAAFKVECKRWQVLFGLQDWRLCYSFEHVEDGLAGINCDFEGRIASVFLNPFQERCTKREVDVRRSARHEMLHLLLAELQYLNGRRLVSDNTWQAAEHGVIRRLESFLNASADGTTNAKEKA